MKIVQAQKKLNEAQKKVFQSFALHDESVLPSTKRSRWYETFVNVWTSVCDLNILNFQLPL